MLAVYSDIKLSTLKFIYQPPVGSVQGFLSTAQFDNTEESSDLSTVDFYLFPQLKSALNGRRFCDPIEITKNATDELKSFSQINF